uniref:hypothetical protein n=1 Tax=Streptococcus pluranimalium TaxID=82348 RepID=UPI003F68EEF6
MGLDRVKQIREEVSEETAEVVPKKKKKPFLSFKKKDKSDKKASKKKKEKPVKKAKSERKPKAKPPQTGRIDTRLQKNNELEFTSKSESRDFVSTVNLMDIKGILYNTRNNPLIMAYNYATYMQILEIRGKDLYRISKNELDRTISNFEGWLNQINFDTTFYTTKLPTDTSEQVIEMNRLRNQIRRELNNMERSEKELYQLQERQRLLENQLLAEEAVESELYNTEYLLFIFDDSIEGLQRKVNRVMTAGNNDFVPKLVSLEKKEQIYKQYNNQNEKI